MTSDAPMHDATPKAVTSSCATAPTAKPAKREPRISANVEVGADHKWLMMSGGSRVRQEPPRKIREMIGCVPRDPCDSARLLDYFVNFTARKIVR